MSKMPWFRMYTEIKSDPKLRRLDHAARWLWVTILCLASESPERGKLLISEGLPYNVAEIAREADLPEQDVETYLAQMESPLNMVTWDGETLEVTNWEKRQFTSDNSTARVQRYREKQKQEDETFPKRSGNALDTDTETETEKDKESSQNTPPPVSPKEVVTLWNEICSPPLPKAQKLTSTRRQKILTRIAEDGERGPDWWRRYFQRIRGTPFMVGENDRGWTASLDFAVRSEDVVARVMEGAYESGPRKAQKPEVIL